MSVIDEFLDIYDKQFGFYEKHAKMVAFKIEEQLFKKGIKAIITHRAKNAASLREKIKTNNVRRKYKFVTDIYHDIKDLSGVRLSLYFPLPSNIIDEILNDAFRVLEKHDVLPAKQRAGFKKRFPGYHATHYHVQLRETEGCGPYTACVAEVQVATSFMHAWAEMDHDLVYKPTFGEPSIEEMVILDELNGLSLNAGRKLKSLQHAMAARTISNGFAVDKYELCNLLLIMIDKNKLQKIRLGDVYLLQYYLEAMDRPAIKDLLLLFERINTDCAVNIADQLLHMLLFTNYHPVKNSLHTYLQRLQLLPEALSVAKEFIACWIRIERTLAKRIQNKSAKSFEYLPPAFIAFQKRKILAPTETATLQNLYVLKDDLLHGNCSFRAAFISNCFIVLKAIYAKMLRRK